MTLFMLTNPERGDYWEAVGAALPPGAVVGAAARVGFPGWGTWL